MIRVRQRPPALEQPVGGYDLFYYEGDDTSKKRHHAGRVTKKEGKHTAWVLHPFTGSWERLGEMHHLEAHAAIRKRHAVQLKAGRVRRRRK